MKSVREMSDLQLARALWRAENDVIAHRRHAQAGIKGARAWAARKSETVDALSAELGRRGMERQQARSCERAS